MVKANSLGIVQNCVAKNCQTKIWEINVYSITSSQTTTVLNEPRMSQENLCIIVSLLIDDFSITLINNYLI